MSIPDPVELARALIRCPSVTPDDAGALGVLEDVLKPLGFTCRRLRFEAPGTTPIDNLYARIGTEAPHFCFAGHTDVVPPGDAKLWRTDPFAAEIRDGVLYGRGAADMKSGITAFATAAARHLEKGALNGSISLLITGDEEGIAIIASSANRLRRRARETRSRSAGAAA
jgi:succinyl-diaminopimelate desuccinylase